MTIRLHLDQHITWNHLLRLISYDEPSFATCSYQEKNKKIQSAFLGEICFTQQQRLTHCPQVLFTSSKTMPKTTVTPAPTLGSSSDE